MNIKIVSLGAVSAFAVAGTGWFGWTMYQRSVYESFLASAEEMTTKISSDNAPASLDVLSARQKNIDVAISTLNKIPPSSGDIYRKAQERWNKLKELDAQIAQRMENEKLAISSFSKAKALTDEATQSVKKPSLTLQEWKATYGKYQEAISLLEKIPADTSVTPEAKTNLTAYRKSSKVVLAEYRKIEALQKKKFEEESQANAKEQERLAKLQQQRQSELQIAKTIQEAKEDMAKLQTDIQQDNARIEAEIAERRQFSGRFVPTLEQSLYCNNNPSSNVCR
jgi:hypothetical protein